MLPSKQGTGIIAGGAARAVLELSGIKDITAKNHGSTNKINGVKATFKGLLSLRTKEQIAELRGKSVEEI
jgi:small subunit ribosomal protein S5